MNERDIFIEALQKTDAAARQAYLHEACGGDAALRQRVEELLKMLEQAGSFLEAPGTTSDPSGPMSSVAAETPLTEGPGSRIGPYKLLQKLGEGGMGVVYMAEQEQPVKRRVALKIIKPGMDSAQVIARFEAERQALAMMDHPNIAKVLDAGATESGRPFFVMELVYGVPITKFCDDCQLTPRERLELFVPVCQAIQHAHQKGIIHRDVKPSNVLVTMHDDKAVPKVIDFGVAKAVEQRLTEKSLFTAFGAMVGTLEYMSPEQAEMNAFGVDTRSDVYSLGVLLYELLTGTTPLERKRLREAAFTEVLRLIKEVEPPRPSVRLSSSGDLPKIAAARKMEPARLSRLLRGEIDWIVMRCLEKNRTRRYESASALARDVERFLHDEAVEACPPSLGYRVGKIARKYRVLLSTAAAFAALLLIASGVSIWLALAARRAALEANEKRKAEAAAKQEAADERDRAQKEWRRAEDAAKTAKANAAATGRALDRMSVAKGIRLAEEGNLFAALPWFVKPLERGDLTPEEEKVHRTRIACYLRYTPGRPTLRHIFFHDGPVSHAAFSPDAKRLLTVSGEVTRIWDVDRGSLLLTLHPPHLGAVQFSADGKRLLGGNNWAVWTLDAGSGQPLGPPLMDWGLFLQEPLAMLPQTSMQFLGNIGSQQLADGGWSDWNKSVEISRHGRRVLFSYKRVLRLWDLETRKPIAQWLRGAKWSYSDHALSSDGQRLLLIRDGQASVHDTATGKVVSRPIDHVGRVESVAFSPDGSRALTFGKDGTARVWDAKTWQLLARISNPDSQSRSQARFSPDNRFVACWGSWAGGMRDLAWFDAETGRLVRADADIELDLKGFDWRPDGQQLLRASKDGEVTLWSAPLEGRFWATSREWRASRLLLRGSRVSAAVYAPDGRRVLTATENGEVRIWDLSDQEQSESIDWKELAKDDFRSEIVLKLRPHRQVTVGGGWGFYMIDKTIAGSKKVYLHDPKQIERRLPPGTPFLDGAMSPDQSRLITVNGDSPMSIQLWDAEKGQRIGEPLKSKGKFTHVAFSPDSRYVSVIEGGTIRVLDARTAESVGRPLEHKGVLCATFSPDGELLVTCGEDQTARLWRTKTSHPIGEKLLHDDIVTIAAFSPNGKTLATASFDGKIHLWSVPLGSPISVLSCGEGHALAMSFNPSGSLLAVPSSQKMRIWDVASLQNVIPPLDDFRPGAGFPSSSFKFSRDGRFFVQFFLERLLDLTPDKRSVNDLVKLTQLYSGQCLDAKGATSALRRQELEALWRELRVKYPQEFAVSPKAAAAWRQRDYVSRAFHRRWLAAELIEAGWQPGERGNEDMELGCYLQRLCALALHGRHAEAIAAADVLAARWPKDDDTLYNCARVHALAAGAVKGDAALAERYAARAVAVLRQAVKAGYNHGQHIRKDADLDALRSRNDFRQLQKELDGKR